MRYYNLIILLQSYSVILVFEFIQNVSSSYLIHTKCCYDQNVVTCFMHETSLILSDLRLCVCVGQHEKLLGEHSFENCCLLHVILFGQVAVYSHFGGMCCHLLLDRKVKDSAWGNWFLWNFGNWVPNDMVSHCSRQ